MGVLKRKVSSAAKGFTPYAGDEPPRGVYRARVVKASIRKAKEKDTLSYNVMVEFEATKPEHKKFDGFVTFGEIWLGDSEASQAREAAFVKAVTGKDDFQNVNVAFEGKESDFASTSGAPITAIDGKKIEGKIVNAEWRWEAGSEGYEGRMRINSLFPWDRTEGQDDEDEIGDEDINEEEDYDGEEEDADEDETDEDLEAEIEERRKELKSRKYDIAKLRAAAKEAGADTKGMKKDDLVEAILDYEFGEAEDEDEDAETDEDENGISDADLETDEDEDDEESDDDEDEDDEEEEDEDESENLEDVLRNTAADLDRAGLKKAIKEKQEDFVAKKSQSDDDLREILVKIWIENPPF